MTTKVNTLNALQKIPTISVNGTVTDGGTVTKAFYTVPSGKKAVINSIKIAYVGFGTGTLSRIFLNGLQLDQSAGAGSNLVEKLSAPATLAAGQTVQYGGDAAGNNATINYFIDYQELPI